MSVVVKFLVFTFLIAWACWFTLIILTYLTGYSVNTINITLIFYI